MRGRERRRKDKEEDRVQDDSRRRDSSFGRCRSHDEAKQGRKESMERWRERRKEKRKPGEKEHCRRVAPSTGEVDKNGGQWHRITAKTKKVYKRPRDRFACSEQERHFGRLGTSEGFILSGPAQ